MNKYWFNLTGKAFKPVPSDKSDFRPAKKNEIETAKQHSKQILQIKNKIQKLRQELEALEDCHHLVFWDEDGFMYDCRTCLACGGNTYL